MNLEKNFPTNEVVLSTVFQTHIMALSVQEQAKERVRHLYRNQCQVDVDPAIPIRRYYRSGREMIRMANVYYNEGNIVDSFVLYSKFIT